MTVERRPLEFEHSGYRLSQTKPFIWRRNLQDGPLVREKTIFNYGATYNDFERQFGQFLQDARDVLRFAALGTTQQGDSGTQFRVDYVKPSGAIGFYHPDWVVVQETDDGEVHWIIETKGRVWEDTKAKDAAMRDWCERISEQTEQTWRYRPRIMVLVGPFQMPYDHKVAPEVNGAAGCEHRGASGERREARRECRCRHCRRLQ